VLAVLGALLLVDGVVLVFGVKMIKTECRVRCLSTGHEWKCVWLGCKADNAIDIPSELGDIEKVGGHTGRKVQLPLCHFIIIY
jgi:hypothetical protein